MIFTIKRERTWIIQRALNGMERKNFRYKLQKICHWWCKFFSLGGHRTVEIEFSHARVIMKKKIKWWWRGCQCSVMGILELNCTYIDRNLNKHCATLHQLSTNCLKKILNLSNAFTTACHKWTSKYSIQARLLTNWFLNDGNSFHSSRKKIFWSIKLVVDKSTAIEFLHINIKTYFKEFP